jgi:hypothetical protein
MKNITFETVDLRLVHHHETLLGLDLSGPRLGFDRQSCASSK